MTFDYATIVALLIAITATFGTLLGWLGARRRAAGGIGG